MGKSPYSIISLNGGSDLAKVLITGGNKNVGSWISDVLSPDHEVKSLSRSTGVDLSTEPGRQSVMNQLQWADIFINNSHVNNVQCLLLDFFFESYRNSAKWIINIGTIEFTDEIWQLVPPEYKQEKLQLHSASRHLQSEVDRTCRITLLRLGIMDTPNCKPIQRPKVSKQEFSTAFRSLIDSPDKVEIRDFSIGTN